MELLSYLWQFLVEGFGLGISYVFAAIFIFLVLRRLHSRNITIALVVIFISISVAFYIPNGLPTAIRINGESPTRARRNHSVVVGCTAAVTFSW